MRAARTCYDHLAGRLGVAASSRRATHDVAHGALQVFGGIAFTAEHAAHRYLRRIAVRGGQFGTASEHEHALGRSLARELEVVA